VALARPDEKVIAILGDGSSMYAIQGLWSAAQLGLPISFVIINNRRYEALRHFGRVFGMQRVVGTDLPQIDFCALASGQGLKGTRVDSATSLDEALAASFRASVPTIVEVVVH
jgi:benzoylformate decarboxylase